MGENSEIQWTHHTFNPWIGCAKVSAECKHCYAEVETFARRNRANGLELWGVDAHRHVTSDANWRKPLAWNLAAQRAGERHRVFCASMADVFEDRPDLALPRALLWGLIANTRSLDWLLLTKRPENAARLWAEAAALATAGVGGYVAQLRPIIDLMSESADEAKRLAAAKPKKAREDRAPDRRAGLPAADWSVDGAPWPANIWLGTSVGTQATADERIPHLLRVPAKVRFLSCEPLLERVILDHAQATRRGEYAWKLRDLDWVIVGGESGHKARPTDVRAVRSIVDQCKAAGVAAFVKQLGVHPIAQPVYTDAGHLTGGVGLALSHKKGADPAEWPEDLRVREFPR